MGHWYDACAGWSKTASRLHVFDFSLPFLAQSQVHFYITPGTDLDVTDLTGKNIGEELGVGILKVYT